MSALTATSLRSICDAVEANAALLWRVSAVDRGLAVSCTPVGLVQLGAEHPLPTNVSEPALVSDPGQMSSLLPTSARLALAGRQNAVACVPVTRGDYQLVVIWADQSPGPNAMEYLLGPACEALAADVARTEAAERSLAAQVRLEAVISALDQAVVIVSGEAGLGEVNAAAASLLDLRVGYVQPDVLAFALGALRRRALDPEGIEAKAVEIFQYPNLVIRDWIWTFATLPTHLRVHTAPLDSPGRSGRVWVFDDISTQMQALEREKQIRLALAESEERLRLLAENASDVVFRVSEQGTFEWLSPSVQSALGWLPEDLLGSHVEDLIAHEDLPSRRRAFADAMRGEKMDYRARFRLASGGYRWM
ncbi:MAG: PAS domain S-box protein [Actinomycetota bacterium]|nr:PAS domain S-box protein [Actinomycetota bacterium]